MADQKSQTSKFYARNPTISRYRLCFVPLKCSVVYPKWHPIILIIILLSLGPTCRHREENHSWQWQCVARNASDPPQCQTPFIHNRTTFIYYFAFSSITTRRDITPCILFTIHLFFNAWCLIICLSEHRTFAFRLVLNVHWSVTD